LRETKGSRFLRDKRIPYMKIMAFASLQVVGKDSSLEKEKLLIVNAKAVLSAPKEA
jgi:hypothetical protein